MTSEADNNKNFLSDLINNFEYVPENDIEDIESMRLASESLISDRIKTRSIDNNLDVDVEISSFLFDKISFEKTQTLVEEKETSNLIFLNDIDNNDIDANSNNTTLLEFDSNENEYLIENLALKKDTNKILTSYLIIDINDDCIQFCLAESSRQLIQLVSL
ncbi:12739_t:CDS:1 [Cetraspora pellucida]|uniref:12739_t:CDS:1 n=1 Tax=Cetraspora pellucida TaxID=1433469 RepID=A0A9N9NPV1_9GLOM|nr:12739_t:CDS:1 [Cetraspora pellucida]